MFEAIRGYFSDNSADKASLKKRIQDEILKPPQTPRFPGGPEELARRLKVIECYMEEKHPEGILYIDDVYQPKKPREP